MPSNKKYKLFSAAADGGGKAPCAFFASPAGCRNGDSCKFAHVTAGEKNIPAAAAAAAVDNKKPPAAAFSTEAGSVVSSESEPEGNKTGSSLGVPVGKSIQVAEKQQSSDGDDNPFLSPGETQESSSSKKKNRRGKRSDDHLPFVNPKKKAKATVLPEPSATTTDAAAAATKRNSSEPPKTQQQASKKSKNDTAATLPSFRSMALPVASFVVPTTSAKSSKTGTSSKTAPTRQESAVSTVDSGTEKEVSSMKNEAPSLPVPTTAAVGRKWLDAVKATQAHPRFSRSYGFDRYKSVDEELGICSPSSGWIKAKPYGAWSKDLPQAIAIDCEMCETQDPVSGKKNSKALCRLSIVDAESKETLLDTLVKPAWPVSDYRTWINGIEEEHLENVQFTVRHAQAFMMALCSEETVIIGHAVYNDLVAMNMEHHCVVDSAMLFRAKGGSETSSVSLRDLAMSALKREMPNVHDSVNDAKTALLCLEHYLEKNGHVEPVERSLAHGASTKRLGASGDGQKSFTYYASRLFIHRIPKNVDESHLSKMLLAHTDIQPSEVEKIVFHANHGKSHVAFQSPAHANLAFETIQGKAEPDPSGRLQKKVFLRNGSYVRIRKMAYEQKDDNKAGKEKEEGTASRRLSA